MQFWEGDFSREQVRGQLPAIHKSTELEKAADINRKEMNNPHQVTYAPKRLLKVVLRNFYIELS